MKNHTLILADLSGIQDYLFQVRERGGRQARSLRFRSLYIQLIAEAIGVRLLRAAGLGDECLIYCAAGKIAIDAAEADGEKRAELNREIQGIEQWLRDKTHGRLRLSVAMHGPCAAHHGATIGDQFEAAGRIVQHVKLRGWSALAGSEVGWRSSELVAEAPPDEEAEAQRDADLGKLVVQPGIRHVLFAADHGHGFDAGGLRASFVADASATIDRLAARDLNRLARHVPVDAGGNAVEFVDLAKQARGAAMLGVLKADADSLGEAIRRCLAKADDLRPLKALSERLDTFFASDLDKQMRENARWSKLYTVFSGGDDLLLVGPWDIVLDFAGHLRGLFAAAFKDMGLSISAGVALMKPKFPVHLAARQADELLDEAKSNVALRAGRSRDQCAALGGLWKWSDHDRIIAAGKLLADWVDAQVIERGWLHTLLQLALLRRGDCETAAQHERMMATARLAYHVARNWPKVVKEPRNDNEHAGNTARQWIDAILRQFDSHESTSHLDTLHLPAIIRYAMLATRSQGDLE
jgi:hypothetical protein